jgi:hypothetical protein
MKNPFSFVTVAASRAETLPTADGKSVLATTSGDADRAYEAEVYSAHGFISRPVKTTRGIRFHLGSLSIIIAAYTYGVEPPENPGESKVFSTDAEGVEQGTPLVGSDGVHTFHGGEIEAARKGDAIESMMADDSKFWTWLSAAAVVLAGLGVAVPAPTSLTGKIIEGTEEVLLP